LPPAAMRASNYARVALPIRSRLLYVLSVGALGNNTQRLLARYRGCSGTLHAGPIARLPEGCRPSRANSLDGGGGGGGGDACSAARGGVVCVRRTQCERERCECTWLHTNTYLGDVYQSLGTHRDGPAWMCGEGGTIARGDSDRTRPGAGGGKRLLAVPGVGTARR